ncbi:hypothetical protein GCM10027215_16990 [Nocardioides zeae]
MLPPYGAFEPASTGVPQRSQKAEPGVISPPQAVQVDMSSSSVKVVSGGRGRGGGSGLAASSTPTVVRLTRRSVPREVNDH